MKLAPPILVLASVLAACGPKPYADAVSKFRARARELPTLGRVTVSALRSGTDRVPARAVSAEVENGFETRLEASGGELCVIITDKGRWLSKSDGPREIEKKDKEHRRALLGFNFVTYPDYPAVQVWPLASDNQQRVEVTRRDVRRSDAFADSYTLVVTMCRPRPAIPPGTKLLAAVWRDEYYSPITHWVAFWEVEGAPPAASTGGNTAPSDAPPVAERRPAKEPSGDLLATLEAEGRFSIFLGLLRDADLAETLRNGEHTVFAFTDAFIALRGGERSLDELRKDRKMLQKYLSSVIAPGIHTEEQLRAREHVQVPSLLGDPVNYHVTRSGLTIGGFLIDVPPVRATNGLIYAYPK